MSTIDIIFLTILGFFATLGVWKGFFREILGLLGVVSGIFLAIIGFGPLSKLMHHLIPGVPSLIWVFLSFLLIFIGIYFLSRFLALLLSRFSKFILLGWLNRLLGGVVGAVKGAIFVSIFLLLIGFLPVQDALKSIRKDSLLYQPLQRFVPVAYNLLSEFSFTSRNLEHKMTDLMKDLQGKLNERMRQYFFYEN